MLGDPIEIAGLTRAFGEDTRDAEFCALGSVKSNIGHCEAAAGVAGLTKIVLQLQQRQLVLSLHSDTLNPTSTGAGRRSSCSRRAAGLGVLRTRRRARRVNTARRAGISSFGAGGANAHVILEEYEGDDDRPAPIAVTASRPAVVLLSARNAERLRLQAVAGCSTP